MFVLSKLGIKSPAKKGFRTENRKTNFTKKKKPSSEQIDWCDFDRKLVALRMTRLVQAKRVVSDAGCFLEQRFRDLLPNSISF